MWNSGCFQNRNNHFEGVILINSEEAIKKAFERIHAEAEQLRKIDRQILEDHAQGLSLEEIKIKNKVSYKYAQLTIRYGR